MGDSTTRIMTLKSGKINKNSSIFCKRKENFTGWNWEREQNKDWEKKKIEEIT